MRKALNAALAAAAILVMAAPISQAAAMPMASSAAIGTKAKTSGAVAPVRYWRHHHASVWRGSPYWYPRHYWYASPAPYAHGDTWGPYWDPNWGPYRYNSGPYYGWGGFINSWYM
jgi:hypothetical protein